ncbi:MAG: hypothetical protein B7Y88_13840 [Sphingomonadales bacterium 32-64-17]|nr:MAG: hypothetical protein B7Y88_13840 [Sphingomonadales bacterium 32-64-17]
MIEALQDADLAKIDLARQELLEEERRCWEDTYQEVDERFPSGAGGFNRVTRGDIRGSRNYDSTHVTGIERFAAAGVHITTPEHTSYIKPKFIDPELMKQREVRLWCEEAGRRLYAIRHAQHTGFITAAIEDWDQLGRYGTSLVWQEARRNGRGLFYRALHLSTCWIDTDFAGLVDTVHRKHEMTVRQLEQQFGGDALTPKMREVLEDRDSTKADRVKFEILHVVAPNTQWDADKFDHRRFPISSRYLAIDEKMYLRRKGYHTMPISASRHMTSPGEKYGRSPAIKVMPNINGVNAMKLTTLRAGHKAVDPALLFADDQGVMKLVSKPGGMNAGLVSDDGRPLVHRMPGGEAGIPYAIEMIQDERATVKGAFLEEFYSIITDPNSRMTTVEVYERMAKEGVLVRPFASRYATEKQHPMTQRDLDLALRAGQIAPMPEVVQEAGAWPQIDYENPLAAMAKAEDSGKTMRYVQGLPILAEIDPDVRYRVNVDAIAIGLARDTGVPEKYIRSDEEVARLKQGDAEAQGAAIDAELLARTGSAVKDFAQADKLARMG